MSQHSTHSGGKSSANSAFGGRALLRALYSALVWIAIGGYFVTALVILGLRYWLLPNIADYKGAVEQALSRTIGERVTIGRIRAGWQGLRPELDLTDLQIHDRGGRIVLSLPGVDATVSWTSLAFASIHFRSLTFEQPNLEMRRDSEGRIYIAGLELKGGQSGPDFSAWLLSQREIVIRDASLSWQDELRGAPRLKFNGVTLVLRNAANGHRFALRAHTDKSLASALDVRGELYGASFDRAARWTGRLYAELDYTDLAGWQRWFDYPLEIHSGVGGVRLWLGFSGRRLTEATADVALANVSARLAEGLPLLNLEYLDGRLGGTQRLSGTDVFGTRLALKTADGTAFPPADFRLHLAREDAGGELNASALELEPLARLVKFLPFPRDVRSQLAQVDPRGRLIDLRATWAGAAESPERFSVRGRFARLSARAWQGVPAFSGLSGSLDGNEKGGNLSLATTNATFDLPGVLAEDKLRLDTLSAQIGWLWAAEGLEFKFGNVSIANRDLAGTLSGIYRARSGTPGMLDLTGRFSRLKGSSAYRVIPGLPKPVSEYLKSSVRSGNARDIVLRLRGDLARFPFADATQGSFKVAGKVSGVDFDYADGWPGLKGLSGELVFEGRMMRILASGTSASGGRIVNARANIADLYNDDEVLKVEGQANGPTAVFLRFVETSPVKGYIDGFTSGMRATGNARLQLKLELPIRRLEQAKVAGSVGLIGNSVVLDPDVPPFTQVKGRIDFTEKGVSGRDLASQFLGGPTILSVATLADGTVSVGANGTANVAAVRKLADVPLLEHASGSAPWKGRMAIKGGTFDLVAESSLKGVLLSLPPPLGKTAAEVLPMRFQRTNNAQEALLSRLGIKRLPPQGDVLMVSIGQTVNAVIVRARDKGRMVVERGAVALNERIPVLDRPGIVADGSLKSLDLDRWREIVHPRVGAGPAVSPIPPIPLEAVNLRIGTLDFFGRRMNELNLRATRSAGLWTAKVNARELAGDVTWRPEGRGRIVARLAHLSIPDPEQASAVEKAESQKVSTELPALDVVAGDFVIGDTRLGKLELIAVNQDRDWRIERLVLSTPEGTLSADGYWQNWAARPSTGLTVKLEVRDAGKYLERLGYPGTMSGGAAHLNGKLGWAGSPLEIDYPSLTGTLSLKVEKGRFLKADPGAAKLLGLLSLQSLLRFDLRDLFSDGFVFDTISSGAQVSRGVLSTKDFDMRGASARVAMTGDIDLAAETQNLRLRVVPSLGDSAATAATLLLKINPITGLGAMLAQRIFKDPLGQLFAFEYTVTGTWKDPKVEKAQVESVAPADGSR